MPDQLQLRGGTSTEHNSFTGVAREVTVDTTKKTLVVHDGSTQGGTPLMKETGANSASSVNIGTGGTNRLGITSSEIVINENSSDTDFRVEGNGDANLLKVDAGNDRIGIGTASPAHKLHIADATTPELIVEDTTNFVKAVVGADNSVARIGSDSNHPVTFRTNDAERMRIHSGGNLQVGGTTLVSTDPYLTLGQSTNSQGNVFHLINNGTADLKQAFIASNKASRHVGIDVSADNFFIGRDASVADLTINSTGKVGIGTTTPSTNLHVQSTGDTILRVTSADGNAAFLDLGDASDPDGGRIHYDSGSNLVFNTVSSERMRINSSGNVGIGTTSPATKLHVKGGDAYVTLEGGASNSNAGILFKDSSGTQNSVILYDFDDDNLIITGTNDTERMRIDSSGRVGINDTSPDADLSVSNSNTSLNAAFVDIGKAGGNRFKLGYEGNNCFLGATSET